MKFKNLILCLFLSHSAQAVQLDILGPPGSGKFGKTVTLLPNGNFVVTDPWFDLQNPTIADVGAVYLFSPSGVQISQLTGSDPNDLVGDAGVVLLPNGNFVVLSRKLKNHGAVTWGSAKHGVHGAVSSANSLIISRNSGSITPLENSNYVVVDSIWSSTTAKYAGAVTLCNGTSGTVGNVSPANSLVGSHDFDYLGSTADGGPVQLLTNGNYVVASPNWKNGAGAVTWGNANAAVSGVVSAANSLIGNTNGDFVGGGGIGNGVIALNNGNYVVSSPYWDKAGSTPILNAGAVTWGNGEMGTVGIVSAANSLTGSSNNDSVGSSASAVGTGRTMITVLTNGNYVVVSSGWDSPISGELDVGAVTWGNGSGGTVGEINASNSLIGSSFYDQVGLGRPIANNNEGVIALPNGHYVFASVFWQEERGAVTWGNGFTGSSGVISSANSIVGSTEYDGVGSGGVMVLANSNYAFASPNWSASAPIVGAATWGNGQTGTRGFVSGANSLIGTLPFSQVGNGGITALSNGNYVVSSFTWGSSPALARAGAVTWGNGAKGIAGIVAANNSLVGTSPGDLIGQHVVSLRNGNYVVASESWSASEKAPEAGAVTLGDGLKGSVGVVGASNSLVGSRAGDRVGSYVVALENSNFIVGSKQWDNGATIDAGAATWGSGVSGVIGVVSEANSLVGSQNGDQVGYYIYPLRHGPYAVSSPKWKGVGLDLGAASWGNGTSALTGPITVSNSLVGTPERPILGVQRLNQHHYAAISIDAVTLSDSTGVRGFVTPDNSVLGSVVSLPFFGDSPAIALSYDEARKQLIVGTPERNIVSILPDSAGLLFQADFE